MGEGLRGTVRVVVAGLLPGLLGACYSYRLVPSTEIQPATRVSVVLSDYGRMEASKQIGPQAARVEGAVLSTNDSAYLLSVTGVKPISGSWVRWSGEPVSMRRDYVAFTYERRPSRSRTLLLIGGATFTLLTVMVNFDILGFGKLDIPLIPGGGDPGDQ
ncbi:MAG TPA: hypothetical protein VGQ18_08880 [Gemmatimonadales bacterium]|jgi:hypothetical protein|nr:hypothetical protein [Gemmatimonadales bacterium]